MKTIRYLDQQGRVILPSHIRKALNLSQGTVLEITLNEDNTIRIKPTEERCVICGSVSKEDYIKAHDKIVCEKCAGMISFVYDTSWEKAL